MNAKVIAVSMAALMAFCAVMVFSAQNTVNAESEVPTADYIFYWDKDDTTTFNNTNTPGISRLSAGETIIIYLPEEWDVAFVDISITGVEGRVESFNYSEKHHAIYGVLNPSDFAPPQSYSSIVVDIAVCTEDGGFVIRSGISYGPSLVIDDFYYTQQTPNALEEYSYDFYPGQYINVQLGSGTWTLIEPETIPDWMTWNNTYMKTFNCVPPDSVTIVLERSQLDHNITVNLNMLDEVGIYDPFGEIANPPVDPGDEDPTEDSTSEINYIVLSLIIFTILAAVGCMVAPNKILGGITVTLGIVTAIMYCLG